MIPFYRAFEDKHRGSHEVIKERLQVYLPFITPLKSLYPECPALDIGCGRGEWLETLQENGFQAKGVDLDEGMLEACRARNLPAEKADALAYLKQLPDDSLGVLTGFHIAEHIPFDDLKQLVIEARRVLKPAGLLILETPNAENLVVGTQNFYLDPTHERPIPYMLLEFLMEFSGFGRSKLLRLQESEELRDYERLSLIDVLAGPSPDYAIVAQKSAEPDVFRAFDSAFEAEHGLSLAELAKRYDATFLSQELELKTVLEQQTATLEQHTAANEAYASQLLAMTEKEQWLVDRLDALEYREAAVFERLRNIDDAQARTQEIQTGLQAEAARLQTQREEQAERVRAKLEEAHQQNSLLQRQLNESLGNAHNWYVEAESRLEEINAANASLALRNHEVDRLHAELNFFSTHVQQIKSSTSWQVTAPLRLTSHAFKSVLFDPVRFMKSSARSTAKTLSNATLKSPKLRNAIKRGLQKYPRLYARVRAALIHRPAEVPPAPTAYQFTSSVEQDATWNPAPTALPPPHLTENAKRVYMQLNSSNQQKDVK